MLTNPMPNVRLHSTNGRSQSWRMLGPGRSKSGPILDAAAGCSGLKARIPRQGRLHGLGDPGLLGDEPLAGLGRRASLSAIVAIAAAVQYSGLAAHRPRKACFRSLMSSRSVFAIALIERPVRPFTKLLARPIARRVLPSWEIGRNRAKFRTFPCCCPPYRRSKCTGRQKEPI